MLDRQQQADPDGGPVIDAINKICRFFCHPYYIPPSSRMLRGVVYDRAFTPSQKNGILSVSKAYRPLMTRFLFIMLPRRCIERFKEGASFFVFSL
jgi:hypothetical protein